MLNTEKMYGKVGKQLKSGLDSKSFKYIFCLKIEYLLCYSETDRKEYRMKLRQRIINRVSQKPLMLLIKNVSSYTSHKKNPSSRLYVCTIIIENNSRNIQPQHIVAVVQPAAT